MKTLLARIYSIPFVLLALLLPIFTQAQLNALKLYNVNDGLPSTTTHGVYQDKYGFLWISTSSGLSRYDGMQFVNYGLEDGLPSLMVGCVFQDSHERLWVGSNAGMARFKNNKFVSYPVSDHHDNLYVFSFFETKKKQLWAITSSGVYEFAGSQWKKISLFPGLDNQSCRNIVEINGELYVNYYNELVFRDQGGHWHVLSAGFFYNVLSLQHDHLMVSSQKNIFEIRNHQLIPIFPEDIRDHINFSYMVDSKNRLWLGGSYFLKISGPSDWTHPATSINQYNNCVFISEDSSHNIWAGGLEGLVRFKDLTFSSVNHHSDILIDGIYNIIPLRDKKMLLSSGTKYGIILHEGNGDRMLRPPKSADNSDYYSDPVDAYDFDGKQILWLTTRYRKLLRFDGDKLQDYSKILHLKTGEHIYDLNYAKKRKQFFICADSTLICGGPTGFSPFIPSNTRVPIVKPTRVHEIKNGLILLYIDRNGLYGIDSANNLFPLIRQTGIDGRREALQLPVCFYEDRDNNFWLGVPGQGLYEYGFRPNKMPFLKNHLTTVNGLQSNNILSITSDRQHRLWIVTNTGLDILQKNKQPLWDIFNYAQASDLGIIECDFSKLVTDANGDVWLSSPTEIIRFNTENLVLSKKTPHINIEKITLNFKETNWVNLTDSVCGYYEQPYQPRLSYRQNSLGISFDAADLSISNPEPEYSHKLLPLDTSWSSPSKIKLVAFEQLPAGDYQFYVRARDKASGWSKPAVFIFTIRKPYWDEWWFRIVMIAVMGYIIISIFRARVRKIKEDATIENQLKELEMKALRAQMNPHFIYNALNSIQSLVAASKKTEAIYYIGYFSKLLRGVLDNSENNVISLDKELETIDLYFQLESLRLDVQPAYKKNIDENIVTEFERIPPLILQPFIENALWHGLSRKKGEKEINICITSGCDWLIFEISDNGVGRKKAQELKKNHLSVHQSKAIEITRKRIMDFNNDHSVDPIEFVDLYDDEQMASGTKIKLKLKRKPG